VPTADAYATVAAHPEPSGPLTASLGHGTARQRQSAEANRQHRSEEQRAAQARPGGRSHNTYQQNIAPFTRM